MKSKEPKETKSNSKEKFIKWRNYQTHQQCVFLACLNEFCSIEMKKPTKRVVVTLQFFQIESLIFSEEDKIYFNKHVQMLVKQRLDYEIKIGIEQKKAARRSENYRFTLALNVLNDLLCEFGYVLTRRIAQTKRYARKKKQLKDSIDPHKDTMGETIHYIWRNGKLLFERSDIETIGKEINNYFLSLFEKNDSVHIGMKDPVLMKLIHKDPSPNDSPTDCNLSGE